MTNISNQLNINNLIQTKWKEQFNGKQLKLIEIGLGKGLDVSCYAKPEYDWEQMRQILLGLINNIDVSSYAKPEFNVKKMRKIRLRITRKNLTMGET